MAESVPGGGSNGDPYPVREWLPLIFDGSHKASINHHIITEIIFHPDELVTLPELQYQSEPHDEWEWNDVQTQLQELEERGIVTTVLGDEYTFYGLTDRGKQFIVDSQLYRSHEVMKAVTQRVKRDGEVADAYHTSRPPHPPADDEYHERDTDSDAWDDAHAQTYRTLKLSLDRVEDLETPLNAEAARATDTNVTTFTARFVECDDDQVLDERTLTAEHVDTDFTSDHHELELREPRGEIAPTEAYAIRIDDSGQGTIEIKAEKHGEEWYQTVERCLHIFLK